MVFKSIKIFYFATVLLSIILLISMTYDFYSNGFNNDDGLVDPLFDFLVLASIILSSCLKSELLRYRLFFLSCSLVIISILLELYSYHLDHHEIGGITTLLDRSAILSTILVAVIAVWFTMAALLSLIALKGLKQEAT